MTGTLGEYFYDGDGKRVKKVSSTETTIFVYDASSKLVAEYSTQISQTPQVSYLTNDHLGSPRINTNENGAVTARHDYQPFGEEIATSQRISGLGYNADEIRKKFTGYERDNETDLNFAQARYFNSGFGRFSSPDNFLNDTQSSSPQKWNLYVYVSNNPLKYIDSNGQVEENTDGTVRFDPDKKKKKGKKDKDDFVREKRIIGYLVTKDNQKIAVSATYIQGTIYADDGTAVKAMKYDKEQGVTLSYLNEDNNITKETTMTDEQVKASPINPVTNCFGTTFAKGEVWINNGFAPKVLFDETFGEP